LQQGEEEVPVVFRHPRHSSRPRPEGNRRVDHSRRVRTQLSFPRRSSRHSLAYARPMAILCPLTYPRLSLRSARPRARPNHRDQGPRETARLKQWFEDATTAEEGGAGMASSTGIRTALKSTARKLLPP
jgi:hypothetical protein